MATKWLIAITLMVCAASAQANIVYNWHSTGAGTNTMVSPPLPFEVTGGTLAFADSARGDLSYDYYANEFGGRADPDSPLLHAKMQFDDTISTPVDLQPRTADYLFSVKMGFDNVGAERLAGGLTIIDFDTQPMMDGDENGWTADLISDYGCHLKDACTGATGYWALEHEAVPAPPVWGLFGLGVLALGGVAVRRRCG